MQRGISEKQVLGTLILRFGVRNIFHCICSFFFFFIRQCMNFLFIWKSKHVVGLTTYCFSCHWNIARRAVDRFPLFSCVSHVSVGGICNVILNQCNKRLERPWHTPFTSIVETFAVSFWLESFIWGLCLSLFILSFQSLYSQSAITCFHISYWLGLLTVKGIQDCKCQFCIVWHKYGTTAMSLSRWQNGVP